MKEVEEWVKVGIVRPVWYPTLISNPVLVKKVDNTCRMSIDFKNVNSACPKDYYPLPEINLKIESVKGFPSKCFLDAYKGYHQIQMSEEDEEKTAFYTDKGTYCYTKMSFGLKNVGATYQRLVDSDFQTQLGRNLEAYVDDMVIKCKTEQEIIMDVTETFDNLWKVNTKLNPKKCSFGVKEGKFLGYMVTSEGIMANLKKTEVVMDMQSPKTLKELQSLSVKLVVLNRFLSRSAERALPFFETLKNIPKENKDDYRWTEDAERAFQEMKKLIMELLTLTTLVPKELLYVYLATSKDAVSGVLLAVRKGKQTPIRYVSQTLYEAERNYSPLEKLTLCLLHLSRSRTGGIQHYVRSSERHQRVGLTGEETNLEEWTLYTDEASSLKGVGACLVLIDTVEVEYTYAICLNFPSTNNEAEYEALMAELRIAQKMKVWALKVKVDSKLVACQLNHEFVANSEGMTKYLTKAKEHATLFIVAIDYFTKRVTPLNRVASE
ncbi:reverse transcriptase domain-containing protein [Tanacetum coccineum]